MYFNECMSGFEWQVAAHMIWEGMLHEGLAVSRAIHDRYHASLRNPYNEIECSDHYARAMASYGAFLAICGYEYNGPKGYLAFAPRLKPENFTAPFTTAQGWGTFSQKRSAEEQTVRIELRYGKLTLRHLAFESVGDKTPNTVVTRLDGKEVSVKMKCQTGRVNLMFEQPVQIKADSVLDVLVSSFA